MAESELDAFLKGAPDGATPANPWGNVPEPADEPETPQTDHPAAETKGEAAAGMAAKPAKPDEPDDAEPPEPRDGEALVPRRAFEAVRHERQDWKRQAIEDKTRAEELRKQLEETKRQLERAVAPPPQPQYQPPPPEIPNPAHDPAGYHAYIQQERIRDSINDRLNLSEVLAVREHGREKVEAMKREFLAAKEADPRLGEELIRQIDPYGWAMEQLDVIRTRQEIGNNPAAYRERIRAEAIAEFQKNGGVVPQPRVSPAAGMAPSLANARSVAGRSAPAFTGPPSLDDIVASIHRK